LTVGAELDGWLARITRIAKSYDQMINSSYDDAKHRYPVVLIPGADHADFLYGDPPSKVKETDLRSEISPEDSIEQVSNVTAAFITMTRMRSEPEGQAAMKVLDHHIEYVTKPMLQPIVDMYIEEGAQFIANMQKTTPYSLPAQAFVAGELQ
jgi:hypothetical protein